MLILKGLIIGIGKIIPGVSGSMLAITLGVYQRLIDSINNFFRYPKENFKFLLKIAIGIIISIVFFSNIILSALNNHYLITMFFFIGLIIGGVDDVSKNIDNNKKSKNVTIVSFLIIALLGLITIDNDVTIENNILNFMYFIFVGFIDAVTTIVPGISGTATLMMLGAYNSLIKSFSTIFDLYYIQDNLTILIPFVIGFVLGIIMTAKLIEYLFKNYKSKTYCGILGFSVATIFLMFIKSFNSFYTTKDLTIASILLITGIFITKKINHLFLAD